MSAWKTKNGGEIHKACIEAQVWSTLNAWRIVALAAKTGSFHPVNQLTGA